MKTLSERQIDNRIKKIEELKAQIESLEVELESLKDELKADLSNKELDELATSNYVVSYKLIESKRFDSKTFKEDHPDMYDIYSTTSSCRRFRIV